MVTDLFVSNVATKIGNAAFFAPEMRISPSSGVPPFIINLFIDFYLIGSTFSKPLNFAISSNLSGKLIKPIVFLSLLANLVQLVNNAKPELSTLSEDERRKIELESADTYEFDWMLAPEFRSILRYDPSKTLIKVKCPVLAINGDKDVQMPTENLEAIKAALAAGGNQQCTIKELPGLNHLFQTAVTGSPAEYSTIEETLSPVALNTVSNWILKRVPRR